MVLRSYLTVDFIVGPIVFVVVIAAVVLFVVVSGEKVVLPCDKLVELAIIVAAVVFEFDSSVAIFAVVVDTVVVTLVVVIVIVVVMVAGVPFEV